MLKRLLLLLPYPVYSRGLAVRDFLRGMPDPILIYQMGKVGSSSVRQMLDDAGVPNIHVHLIHGPARRVDMAFRKSSGDGIPPHIHLGGILAAWLRIRRKQTKVITLVRDPVAAQVSGAFEMAHVTGFPSGSVDRSVNELVTSFENGRLDKPFNWFDFEFRHVVGLDIFSRPFDREAGWTRITTPDFDILGLTLERLDDLIPGVLSEFVGRDLEPAVARVRTDGVYDQVKKRVKISASTLERIYEHPQVKHFYNEGARAQFRERWSSSL